MKNNLFEHFKKFLNETGEMSKQDLERGGEFYEWGQDILKAAKELSTLTKGKVKVGTIHPFDKYQGPYVDLKIDGKFDKLWGVEDGEYALENKQASGSIRYLASVIFTRK